MHVPFAGSGSTGVTALLEGYRFLGVELDVAYGAIAHQRLADAMPVDKTVAPTIADEYARSQP